MRKFFDLGLNGLLVVGAVMSIVLVGRREYDTYRQTRPRSISAELPLDEGGHRLLGPGGAKVSLVVFSDFQCPACGVMARRLEKLAEVHDGQIAVVFRHYPLEATHLQARAAANASECAAEQGRFREYHDLLFQNQVRLGLDVWNDMAASAGVHDTVRFRECVGSKPHDKSIAEGIALAQRLTLEGTPSVLFEGKIYYSASLAALESVVAKVVGRAYR